MLPYPVIFAPQFGSLLEILPPSAPSPAPSNRYFRELNPSATPSKHSLAPLFNRYTFPAPFFGQNPPSLLYNVPMRFLPSGRRAARHFSFAIILLFIGFSLSAQSMPPGSFRISKISVFGQQHFPESAVIAASGLSVGQSVTLDQVYQATQRLSQYGAFDHVDFRYLTQEKNLEITFSVVESKNLLPCRFDNFVWLTPADLDSDLRRRVPLYNGSVPASGLLLLEVQNQLQEILKQKGVAATVSAIPYAPNPGQPVDSMRFEVSGISLPITQLSFPGASAITEEELRRQAAKILGENFSVSDVSIFMDGTLLPLYGERGYLRAKFDAPSADPLGPASPAGQNIAVSIPVHEGLSYDWNGAVWSGNHVFTSTDLDHMLGMRDDEVANSVKLQRGIKDVNDAYSKQGYVQLVISPDPQFDDASRRVTYRITVQEGPQYRMGSLQIIGLPPDAARRLFKSWKIQEGQVFDKTYMDVFLKTELPKNLHFNPQRPVSVTTNVKPDPAQQKVNVQIGVQ